MARPKGARDKQPRRTAARKMAEVERVPGELTMPEMMRQIALSRFARGDEDGALQAAEKAAPYFAPKLSAVDSHVTGDLAATITVVSGVERADD